MVAAITLSLLLAAAAVRATPIPGPLALMSVTDCLNMDALGVEATSYLELNGKSQCGQGQDDDKARKKTSSAKAPKKADELKTADEPKEADELKKDAASINGHRDSAFVTCNGLHILGFDTGLYFDYSGKSMCPPEFVEDRFKNNETRMSNLTCGDLEALGINTGLHPELSCAADTCHRSAYRPQQDSEKKKPSPSDDKKKPSPTGSTKPSSSSSSSSSPSPSSSTKPTQSNDKKPAPSEDKETFSPTDDLKKLSPSDNLKMPSPSAELKMYTSLVTHSDLQSLGLDTPYYRSYLEKNGVGQHYDQLSLVNCFDLEMLGLDTTYYFDFLGSSMCHYSADCNKEPTLFYN